MNVWVFNASDIEGINNRIEQIKSMLVSMWEKHVKRTEEWFESYSDQMTVNDTLKNKKEIEAMKNRKFAEEIVVLTDYEMLQY